jgi:nucleoid-associated protein YgaU
MVQFMHTVRFVLGMAMLIAGVALAYPLLTTFSQGQEGVLPEPPVSARHVAEQPAAPVVDGAWGGGHAIPDARMAPAWGQEPPAAQAVVAAQIPAPPPPPPLPLPPSGLDFSPAPPALAGAYRSTVDIPPPPLLDVHAPPPLAGGWPVQDNATRSVSMATAPSEVIEAPATYVVRDGDDLTGIAIRVYGHAGAAAAIWTANRDRLTDPQLLPIGMVLRMPPSWTLPAGGTAGGTRQGAIEPRFSGGARGEPTPPGGLQSGTAEAAAPGHPWLAQPTTGPVPVRPAVAAATLPAVAQPAARPATVAVAAGDTLDSIAQRFYGDRSAAARILQANRERLRSPELLVPGMELRLP